MGDDFGNTHLGADDYRPLDWGRRDRTGTPGAGGFPIIEDDGTNTYAISAGSTVLDVTVNRDAGGEDAYGNIQVIATATNGSVFLDGRADSGSDSNISVNGTNGIDLETSGVTGTAVSISTDSGGAIDLNSGGTNGNVTLEAAASGGVVDLVAGAIIHLSALEILFQSANGAPSSADLSNGNFGFWFDPATRVLSVKGRDGGGTIRNLTIGTLA